MGLKLFELWATLGLDTKDFNTGAGKAKATFKDLASGLSSAVQGITTGAQKIINTTENAMKVVGNVVTVAGTAFTGLATKSLNLAGELEQNLGGAKQVFQSYAETIEKTGSKAYRNLGLSQTDYLQTANKIGALLQGSGFEIADSMELTTQVMQRAADVASIMGIDTAWAMESIAGAAKGNFTMMDNLGVAMNATSIEAYALANGVKKSYSNMSQQEKIGWAMKMFLEKTAYATGNYARENETLAGSLSTAKAAMNNFLSGSGGIEDVISSVQNAGNVILKNLQTLLPALTTGIAQMFTGLAPQLPVFISTLLPSVIDGANTLMGGLFSVLPDMMISLSRTLPQIQNGLSQLLEGMFGGMPQFIAAAKTLFTGISTGFMRILPQLSSLAKEIAPALTAGLITFKGDMLAVGVTVLSSIMEGISDDLESPDSEVQTAIDGTIEKIGELVKADGAVSNLIESGLNIIKKIMEGLSTEDGKSTISTAVATVINTITGWIAVPENLTSLVDSAVDIVNAIASGIMAADRSKLNAAVTNLANAVASVLKRSLPSFTDVVGWIFDAESTKTSNLTKKALEIDNAVRVTVSKPLAIAGSVLGSGSKGSKDQVRSHATGLYNVPYDEYPAVLHAGEAVLTRSQADAWRDGRSGNGEIKSAQIMARAMVEAMSAARIAPVVQINGREIARAIMPLLDEQQGDELERRLGLGF